MSLSLAKSNGMNAMDDNKSKALVVQRVLLRFVRGACEGARFQESNREAIASAREAGRSTTARRASAM